MTTQITRLRFADDGKVRITNINVGHPDDHCPEAVQTTSAGLEAAGAELLYDEDLGDQPQVRVVGIANGTVGQQQNGGTQRRTRRKAKQYVGSGG